jgi:hypothetical protein
MFTFSVSFEVTFYECMKIPFNDFCKLRQSSLPLGDLYQNNSLIDDYLRSNIYVSKYFFIESLLRLNSPYILVFFNMLSVICNCYVIDLLIFFLFLFGTRRWSKISFCLWNALLVFNQPSFNASFSFASKLLLQI